MQLCFCLILFVLHWYILCFLTRITQMMVLQVFPLVNMLSCAFVSF